MLLGLKLGDREDMPPLPQVTRHVDHGLFDRLCAHFDAGWDGALPIPPDPTAAAASDVPTESSDTGPGTPASAGPRRRWPGRPD